MDMLVLRTSRELGQGSSARGQEQRAKGPVRLPCMAGRGQESWEGHGPLTPGPRTQDLEA